MTSSAIELSRVSEKASGNDILRENASTVSIEPHGHSGDIRTEGQTRPAIKSGGGTWVWAALATTALAIAYGPLAWQFCQNVWSRAQYQFFPFVIGAFVWILWRNGRIAEERADDDGRLRRWGSIALLLGAWLLLTVALLSSSPWLAIVSAILLVGSRLLHVSRSWRIDYLFGIWIMLWLIVPLPLNRDQQLITSLQRVSSRISSMLLDAAGVKHLMEGNTLLLPNKQFFVDEACSGIVSVLAVIACAIIFGIWRNRPPAHVALLAVAGVIWATVMNVARISTIAFVYDRYGADWSSGAIHELLGLSVFTLVFLALVSTDLFLLGLLAPIGPTLNKVVGTPGRFGQGCVKVYDRIFTPRTNRASEEQPASVGLQPTRLAQRCLAIPAVPLFGFLLVGLIPFVHAPHEPSPIAGFSGNVQTLIDRAQSCGPETLPAAVGGLQRTQFSQHTRDRNDLMGNFSRTYEYRDASGMAYLVSCDFPYEEGWHELTICYKGLGWDLGNRRIIDESPDSGGLPWTSMEAEFSKPDGSLGYLIASAFDETGQPLQLPSLSLFDEAWGKLTGKQRTRASQVAFQVQVWTTSAKPFDEQNRNQARGLLEAARQRFHEQITQAKN